MPAKKRALVIVEDNPDDLELTLMSLRRAGLELSIKVFQDGEEALGGLIPEADGGADAPPDLVFLDLKLPRVCGLEVLRALKRHERTRAVPVIVFSSSDQDEDVAAAYASGANSYVVKPVDFETFQRTIADLGRYWLSTNQLPDARAGVTV
ncbi:MAG: response regulator [Puniceicoccaceae bacterium]|nr:MAG: response regulator [Puniceicoccaceae bacterium]